MRLAFCVALGCLGVGIGAAPLPVRAAPIPIPGLFSTGVDDADVVQTDGSAESHFYIAGPADVPHELDPNGNVVALSSTDLRVFTQVNPGTEPSWSGNSDTSAWIGPVNPDLLHQPAGTYRYTLDFFLTADLDPSTAPITAYVFGDDGISDVFFNSVDTHNQDLVPGTQQSPYQVPFAFTFDSGFVDGLNTMVWQVTNSGGPSGLRVQFVSQVTQNGFGGEPDPVPEPGSVAILLSGIGALAWGRRRIGAVRSHLVRT
jgi:hypothetical protein